MTYKLFSTCILSKGYNISLILDIQRDSYYKIQTLFMTYFVITNYLILTQ